MPDNRNLKLLATVHCKPYKCDAKIYIQNDHPSGERHLIAQYGEGYSGPHLPKADNGRHEFAAAIPPSMSEQQILDGWLLWPMREPDAPYPTWEVPARVYGSESLFRWWAGEKAK